MTHPVIAALRERTGRSGGEASGRAVVRGSRSWSRAAACAARCRAGWRWGSTSSGWRGAFDAAYGSSAGTLNAMWLVSGRRARRDPDLDRPGSSWAS